MHLGERRLACLLNTENVGASERYQVLLLLIRLCARLQVAKKTLEQKPSASPNLAADLVVLFVRKLPSCVDLDLRSVLRFLTDAKCTARQVSFRRLLFCNNVDLR